MNISLKKLPLDTLLHARDLFMQKYHEWESIHGHTNASAMLIQHAITIPHFTEQNASEMLDGFSQSDEPHYSHIEITLLDLEKELASRQLETQRRIKIRAELINKNQGSILAWFQDIE